MAETDFGRLDPRVPVAQASVRNITPPGPDDALRTINSDPVTHHPLENPDAPSQHGWSPPSPAPAMEDQLRGRLAEAIEAERQAADRLALAQSAHDRAEQHLRTCNAGLHSFDGLEDQIAQETIAQLVDADRSRIELTADLHDCIADRERARTAHVAALRAFEVLAAALVKARGGQAEAAALVDRLVAGVLAFEAARIADRHQRLMEEVAKAKDVLHAFDHYASNKHVSLPVTVRSVLGMDMSALAKQRDLTPWIEAAAQLRADPTAEVSVTVNVR